MLRNKYEIVVRNLTDVKISNLSVPNTKAIYTCKIPEYVVEVTDCINLMNYLNCPTFMRSEQCEAARDMVKSLDKCGKDRNGTYLINYQYWDFELVDLKSKKIIGNKI